MFKTIISQPVNNVLSIFSMVLLLSCMNAAHTDESETKPLLRADDPSVLIGTWNIDLRPTPDAAPVIEQLKITRVDGNRIYGTFYNSTIQYGKLNDDWGTLVIAFVTQDGGGGRYNTSAELVGDVMKGRTHSLSRNFLSVWTGEKE